MKIFFQLVVFIVLLTYSYAFGNSLTDSTTWYKLEAQVVSKEDTSVIPFAHVVIKNSYKGLICDPEGRFKVEVPGNDTMVISAIGFEVKEIMIDGNLDTGNELTIFLTPTSYSIDEVIVFPYQNYRDFKDAVLSLELPDEPEVELNLPRIYGPPATMNENGQVSISLGSPVTALYNAFSKDAKEIREYNKLIERKKVEDKVSKKYNKVLISYITGMKDERKILDFMEYCKFSDEFILNSNDYEIYLAINSCFKEFQQSNLHL